ncbi:FaeA/PapI family transcriptional regulator (plasmid) [Haloarcula sp. KBTZ06]|jgi:predicted ArsR family transcriptional regulator|uniref:HTH domain-containing protein n=1 Tax=Haloarcula hispanica TaxID=51589 RepID=A0A5J5LCM3_HALHI|nr:hypothetical protein EGO51_18840 [Haloarcula hispanica]
MSTKGPEPTVSDNELIKAISQTGRPFATAGEVAELVDLSNWRVRQRLERLDEQNKINRSRIGGGPFIYWLDGSFSDESR